jgi:hypothetical protein
LQVKQQAQQQVQQSPLLAPAAEDIGSAPPAVAKVS